MSVIEEAAVTEATLNELSQATPIAEMLGEALPVDEAVEGEIVEPEEDPGSLLPITVVERQPASPAPTPPESGSLAELELLAEAAAASGMFPDDDFTKLLTKAMLGRTLNIPAAAAFNEIVVIRNKPSLSAELQRALAIRAGFRILCSTPPAEQRMRCDLDLVEVKTGEVWGSASFTAQEAQDAGLFRNEVWGKWRADMLFARATTRLISRFAPHILHGLATFD